MQSLLNILPLVKEPLLNRKQYKTALKRSDGSLRQLTLKIFGTLVQVFVSWASVSRCANKRDLRGPST
ncbi:hypothetical protein MIND_00368900 [Mycena indigotica]|uniref:Uncharacterized protein n=1 Tax=Mycena indigotica TaxID=2126181 RepID=A0A8H6W9R2_9AGAR|nr:uncharacterized protein MIND_00368900 [Mycena indigotica]KAF7309962.1 hypothetical protein MIND_00368900 [Mycena indigotica]